jgi:hypothetical protein
MDPETNYLDPDLLEANTAEADPGLPAPGEDRDCYAASMDPATRKNGWSCLVTRNEGGFPEHFRVVAVREWKPTEGKRLSPALVIKEIAAFLAEYGITEVLSDEYMADALNDLAKPHKLSIESSNFTPTLVREAFLRLEKMLEDRSLTLSPHRLLQRDLRSVRKRVNVDGSLTFILPKTPDGRHCDTVPALIRLLIRPPPPPLPKEEVISKEDEIEERVIARLVGNSEETCQLMKPLWL